MFVKKAFSFLQYNHKLNCLNQARNQEELNSLKWLCFRRNLYLLEPLAQCMSKCRLPRRATRTRS